MDVVAGSKDDEFYTPNYVIFPLLKYLKQGSIIWRPFDTSESNFVNILKERGFEVFHSHISDGTDSFEYIPRFQYDYIISNPPDSLKAQVIQKLFRIRKPFAMLVGVVGLFESKGRFNIFRNNDFEIMYFDKRIAYFFCHQKHIKLCTITI